MTNPIWGDAPLVRAMLLTPINHLGRDWPAGAVIEVPSDVAELLVQAGMAALVETDA